jgi:1,4-alpha-glucan branching enzyme
VQFVAVAPGATSVTLVGDFNDWNVAATPMHAASEDGIWSVSLPLPPGRYRYAFLVDGTRWMADPAAPAAADSDFGSTNSVVTVGEP